MLSPGHAGRTLVLGLSWGANREGSGWVPGSAQPCPPPQDASSEGGGSVGPIEWVQPRSHSLAQGVVPTSFLLLPPAPGGPAHILPGSYLPNQTSKPSKEPRRSPTQECFAPSFGDKHFAEKARLLNPQKAPLIQPRHELNRE